VRGAHTLALVARCDRVQVGSMKLEAQLIELAAWRGELTKIAQAIAIVILVGVVAAANQDLRRGDDG
jgi:hypothetical protein